jgi:hypothetical protein
MTASLELEAARSQARREALEAVEKAVKMSGWKHVGEDQWIDHLKTLGVSPVNDEA